MKKHIYYFDYLRFIAAIGVIYMHIAATPLRGEINANWHMINVLTSFSFTAVPLFFMMSGYLLLSDVKTTDITVLLKKRLPKLIIPLVTYTLFAICWKLYCSQNNNPYSFFNAIISSFEQPAWVHLWYMYTLIALYFISPMLYGALNNLDRKGHIFVLSIIAAISLRAMLLAFLPNAAARFLNFDILNKLTFFGGHLCSFVLGWYLGRLRKKIPNPILTVATVMTLCVIILGTCWLTNNRGTYDQTFQKQSVGFEILLASCIFLIFKQRCDKESHIVDITPMINLSLSIYLLHNILISILKYYKYIPEIITFGDTIVYTLIIFLLSFIIAKTLASVKFLCFLTTGISYKKACTTCNWIYTINKIRKKRI